MTRRSICLLLSVSAIGSTVLAAPAQAAPAQAETRKADAEAELRARKRDRERLERIFSAAAAVALEAPRDGFDPHGVIDKVGREPASLFAWVRDQTGWVPYAGVLRGPEGVLMDRMGNSLDRSLLLARLLRACGHPARLVRGVIPLPRAREILERLRAAPPRTEETGNAEGSRVADQRAREVCVRFGLDYEELLGNQRVFEVETARLAEDIAAWTEEQTREIARLVGEPQATAGAGDASLALAALRDHWWVECRDGKEWTSFDPLLPDAATGSRSAEPAATFELDAAGGVRDLDKTVYHTLHVRLVVESSAGGAGLAESVVLEKELRACDLHDRKITLRQTPLGWPQGLDLAKEKDPIAKFRRVVLEQKEWLPVLTVGIERVAQGSFTSTGAVVIGSDRGTAAELGKGVASGFGGFGALGGGGDKPAAGGVLTAEWIEYEIRSPGAPSRKIRREVFDLIGPAARRKGGVVAPVLDDAQRLLRGLSILDETELLPLSSRLSRGSVDAAIARWFAAHHDVLLGMISPADAPSPGTTPTKPARPAAAGGATLPGPLQSLALGRWSWSHGRETLFQDSLNLFAFHVRMRPRGDGEIVFAHTFDIVANGLASREGVTPASFRARLRQGVLETQIEAKLLTGSGEVKNTGELLARSQRQGLAWIPVRSAGDPAWKEIEMPPDVKSRIEEDLAAGFVVVVPKSGVALASGPAFGWWRVHAQTGETLGRMEHGEGQSTVDKIVTNMIAMSPSAYASVASHICKKAGKTDGACHPCAIFAAGSLGSVIGFAGGSIAWKLGEKSALLFFGSAGAGLKSAVERANACLGKVTGL